MCRECVGLDDFAHRRMIAGGYTIGQETTTNNLGHAMVLRQVVERNLVHQLQSNYVPGDNDLPQIWQDKVLFYKKDNELPLYFIAYDVGDSVIQLYHPGNSRSSVDIHVFSSSMDIAMDRMAEIRAAVKVAPKQNKSQKNIDLIFWMMSSNGPRHVRRTIEVPSWDEISGNYTESVAASLAEMSSNFKPTRGGQLVLWHGEPGTGKTYALRALGREWRKWCDFHYIMDPERFFGHDADYLMTVLLDQKNPVYAEDDDDEYDPDYVEGEDRWKLLIFEDTGELMSADAQERAGAGLGRFLNTVDGLIGQGLKVLLLVTTNQELGRLHPAVARSGRANVITEFKPLTAMESEVWAAEHGISIETRAHALSDLYAALSGSRRQPERVPVGFGRR